MKPHKKGKKWEIQYRVPGYPNPFTERFDNEAEAKLRCAQIEYAKDCGTIAPPIKNERIHPPTMSELLDEYMETYGLMHWGDSYYSVTKHRIEDYVKPAIGSMLVKDITPRILDKLYSEMLSTPAKILPGHKDVDKTISYPVIEKCHCTIRSALNQAVRWGYIKTNPALSATIPKAPVKRREVWTPGQAQEAINKCRDLNLKVCMLLSVGCSLRIGEILGLQWSHVHISEDTLRDNTSVIDIVQELKRCDKATLKALDSKNRSNVYFTFPEMKSNCATTLVLKVPKTESSIRSVYVPNSVAVALMDLRAKQDRQKNALHGTYLGYDMVIAQDDGRPTECRLIDKSFKDLIAANNLPLVVFHSLRHLSTSMKLQISGGDIKAVQGDTGHAQASMVTQVYSHTFDENRKRVARLMESSFFSSPSAESTEATKKEQIIDLLEKHPELAEIILAMAGKTDSASM